MILTANNVQSGTTINAGTLQLGSGGTAGGITGVVIINSGASLVAVNTDLSGGQITNNTGGAFDISGAAGGGATVSSMTGAGDIQLGSRRLTITGNSVGTVGGVISGVGGSLVTNGGSLSLLGANTYSGGTTVNGGTLSISSDANLGAAGGSLALDAGTLRASGTFTTSRTTTLTGSGTFDVGIGTLTHAGAIGGSGGLVKEGAGTLILTGAISYAGGTTVSRGTLQGNTTTLLGNIANNGAVVFDQAADGSYGGVMSGASVAWPRPAPAPSPSPPPTPTMAARRSTPAPCGWPPAHRWRRQARSSSTAAPSSSAATTSRWGRCRARAASSPWAAAR
jgi:autotransporter-associated beta strand protein